MPNNWNKKSMENAAYSCITDCDIFFFFSLFLLIFILCFYFAHGFYLAPSSFSYLLITFKLTKYNLLQLFFCLLEARTLKAKRQNLWIMTLTLKKTRVLAKFFSSAIFIFFLCMHLFIRVLIMCCLKLRCNILRKKFKII